MRIKYSKNTQLGEVRRVTIFLILPKFITGEVRWLEKATIKQEYSSMYFWKYWRNIRWYD